MSKANRAFLTGPLPRNCAAIILAGLVVVCLKTTIVCADPLDTYQAEKSAAFTAFLHGKATTAISALRDLATRTSDPIRKASLQRDLLEICTTAGEWSCVAEMLPPLVASINGDKRLAPLLPAVTLYAVQEALRSNDSAGIEGLLRKGRYAIIPPGSPAISAQFQIALHAYDLKQADFTGAEEALSSATLALLTMDRGDGYAVSQVLVQMIGARIDAGDIVGAFSLAGESDQFIAASLAHDGIQYAEYRMLMGQLLGYAGVFDGAAATLVEAAELLSHAEMNADEQIFQVSTAYDLAAAAFSLAGKPAEAKQAHLKNPMQSRKESLLQRGEFRTNGEFYFAVADIFVSALSNATPDSRWKVLFEKNPTWNLSALGAAEIESYSSFSRGLLALAETRMDDARRLLVAAANQRIDNFEAGNRARFEGFQLPSLVDRIVISLGLSAGLRQSDPANADLVLRSGEILNRNIRHALADAAVLLEIQGGEEARAAAHAYLLSVRQKRDWEDSKIHEFLTSGISDLGMVLIEYPAFVARFSSLKRRFEQDRIVDRANRLPTVKSLRSALPDRAVFITLVPTATGFGKLCVGRDTTAYVEISAQPRDIVRSIRLLQLATTAGHAPDPSLDSQYPVASAFALRNFLFDGLGQCLKPGADVTIALPDAFADVPLGALLAEEPAVVGQGYDLARAHWLIKDYSFSLVISARQVVAAASRHSAPADRPYLGIGDPALASGSLGNPEVVAKLGGALSAPGGISDFPAIPETRAELSQVGVVLGAAQSEILLGKEATEELFRQKPLAEYDVIHFATHGLIARDIPGLDESALLLSTGAADDGYNDGILSASEISKLSLHARLVVLSACNTAKYDLHRVTLGVHDLHGAFTLAGASTLLASLWPIDSETARDLMISFAETWRAGRTGGVAASLAAATKSYLLKADAAHQHPRFWASFVVIGDGAVVGTRARDEARSSETFAPVRQDAGEILHVVASDNSLFLSMNADWDGKKMAGIIARRANGREVWSVGSRDVAAGRMVVRGDRLYATGFTAEPRPIPVLRAFDADGRLLWRSDFPELRGYFLANLIVTARGVMTVASDRFSTSSPDPPRSEAFLLEVDTTGKLLRKVAFPTDPPGTLVGPQAVIAEWGNAIVVTVNAGMSYRQNLTERSISGLAPFCFVNGSAQIVRFDREDFKPLDRRIVDGFQVYAVSVLGERLYLGGERLDGCAIRGTAAVYRSTGGSFEPFWQDRELASSYVRGLASVGAQLSVAVAHEREVVVQQTNSKLDLGSKRLSDNGSVLFDASIIRLSQDGTIVQRKDLSAGLSISIAGMALAGDKPVVYGALGGQPAMTSSNLPAQ